MNTVYPNKQDYTFCWYCFLCALHSGLVVNCSDIRSESGICGIDQRHQHVRSRLYIKLVVFYCYFDLGYLMLMSSWFRCVNEIIGPPFCIIFIINFFFLFFLQTYFYWPPLTSHSGNTDINWKITTRSCKNTSRICWQLNLFNVFIFSISPMTLKAALCHMTRAQLRDAEVGLPVASQLAALAVSSNPGRNSRCFPPPPPHLFKQNHPSEIYYKAMERSQCMCSSFVSPRIISFWLDVNVIICS